MLPDPRAPAGSKHPLLALIRQRLYGLAAGYEDLNDHDTLRHDLAWQTAVERDRALASSFHVVPAGKPGEPAGRLGRARVLVNQFIASFAQAPTELILDFDTTDDRVHGQQAGAFLSTATTGIIVSYRSTCFAASSCWCRICARATWGGAHHAWRY